MAHAFSQMTRCECQDVEFSDVLALAHATGIWDFDFLTDSASCGQVCTACHCDLKRQIARARFLRAAAPHPDRISRAA